MVMIYLVCFQKSQSSAEREHKTSPAVGKTESQALLQGKKWTETAGTRPECLNIEKKIRKFPKIFDFARSDFN